MSYPSKSKIADLFTDLKIDEQLKLFEFSNKVVIPDDLAVYFKLNESQIDEYSIDMFTFYKFDEFKSVKDEVGDYRGIPNYKKIVDTLLEHKHCFVFAEYFTHLSVYAIKLYESSSTVNEVYVIMGDIYKIVANSFSEFIELYQKDMNKVLI